MTHPLRYSFLLIVILNMALQSTAQTNTYRDLNQNGRMDMYEDVEASMGDRVQDILQQLTLEEKLSLIIGTGMRIPGLPQLSGGSQIPSNFEQHLVPGAAGTTHAIPRLGLQPVTMADGPAGLRISPTREDSDETFFCTAFPVATLLACSWDIDLVYKVGQIVGDELVGYGVNILLAPGLNIHRHPLGGRNFEYYSEDPLLTGKMTAAMVKGVQSKGVGTAIKHFAANNQETNRNTLNTIVSERALREIYLRGFEIAVRESSPWTVMSAYNKINGVFASESHDLLTKILRDDWGFDGLVMTDWFGGVDPVEQMIAGNDLLMPGMSQQATAIHEAIDDDKLDIAILDRNVSHVLQIVLRSPSFSGTAPTNAVDLKAHAHLARVAATEGMVLVQNDQSTLPFPSNIKNIAVFGNASHDIIIGGTGSGDVNEAYRVSLIQGLNSAGYSVDATLTEMYDSYLTEAKANQPDRMFFMPEVSIPEMMVSETNIEQAAHSTDVAIVTIGRHSGEFADLNPETYYIGETEKNLIKHVSESFHKQGNKVVVILNIGGVIEVTSWREQVDAILVAWQPGQEAGNAITDILSGAINPSGKLSTTFPTDYKNVSSAPFFPGIEIQLPEGEIALAPYNPINFLPPHLRPKPAEVTYGEGIYLGYRYHDKSKKSVAYPFGHGLSYTSFEYGDLRLSNSAFTNQVSATLTITNSGGVAGKEVVQLYLSAPSESLDKPVKELKAFAKTRVLAPGESETIQMPLNAKSLASFDPERSAWFAEKGTYTIQIGASSQDIRQKATFTLAKDIIVEKVVQLLN